MGTFRPASSVKAHMTRPRFRFSGTLILLLTTFGVSTCESSDTATAEKTPNESARLDCESERDRLVELLGSGVPTVDADPAYFMRSMVDAADMIIVGNLTTISRTTEPETMSGWTSLEVDINQTLLPAPTASGTGESEPPSTISYSSRWPEGGSEVDPLAEPMRVQGIAVLAFVKRWPEAPGGFAVGPQGLIIACEEDGELLSTGGGLPTAGNDYALSDLTDMVNVALQAAKAGDAGTASACLGQGSGGGPTTGDDPSVTIVRDPPSDQQGLAPGDVAIVVSNQSFHDDPVRIGVDIDGVCVINEALPVKGQHHNVGYVVHGLAPGAHTVVVDSDTGAQLVQTITVPVQTPRWIYLSYWYYPGDVEGRHILLNESDEPFAFA